MLTRSVVLALVSLALFQANAQENGGNGAPVVQRGRGAQGLREFLGLGAPPDAAAAERGAKLFQTNCSFCHGAKATGGDTGPNLVQSSVVLHDEKGELIGPLVHNGRVSQGMPAFATLTDAELYDVAEFLHMRVELTANRGTYKILNVLTGDPKAGEVYFRTTGKCIECHSPTGDLAHIGAKLAPADLQQTFLYPTGDRGAKKVKVTLASGETVTGTLKHVDDFSVSFYDSEGTYHSLQLTPGDKVELEDKLAGHRALLNQYSDADMHNLTAYLATLK